MAPIDVDDATKNWLKAGLAFKHLKNGLIPFVSHHISTLHTTINKVGTCKPCATENVLPCPTAGMDRSRPCEYYNPKDRQKRPVRPSSVCEKVSIEIENNHITNPNWKNTDATKWASNPWEIAKCFLPPLYADVQSALETDCSAILALCQNCRPLEAAITPVKALIEKNRNNRHKVVHSGSQEFTATERGAYIQDAIDLLTKYQTTINPNTQKCIDTLTQLNTDGFILTTEDVADVIKDALMHHKEIIMTELASERAAREEIKDSIEKLQAGKVDQETYMEKVMEIERSLEAVVSKVADQPDTSTQKEVRKQMKAIRKDTESMKTDICDIWKHIETIDKKNKKQDKELDEMKPKVAKLEEKITEIDVMKSGMAELGVKVETIKGW